MTWSPTNLSKPVSCWTHPTILNIGASPFQARHWVIRPARRQDHPELFEVLGFRPSSRPWPAMIVPSSRRGSTRPGRTCGTRHAAGRLVLAVDARIALVGLELLDRPDIDGEGRKLVRGRGWFLTRHRSPQAKKVSRI